MADKQLRVVFQFNESELAKFNKMLADANLQSKVLDKNLEDVGKESSQAFSSATAGINQLVTGVKAFLALEVVNYIKNAAIEASKLASAGEGIRSAFNNLGGTTAQMDMLRKSVGGTVANMELMRISVQALQKGVSLNTLGQTLEYLDKQADATGGSLEHMASIMINAIGKQSTKGLQQLGLSIKDIEKNAEKIGFVPALMQEIGNKTETLGDIAAESGDAMDRLAASQTNLKEAFGRLVNSSGWQEFTDFFSGGVNNFADAINNSLDIERQTEKRLGEIIKEANEIRDTNDWWDKLLGNRQNKLKELEAEYNKLTGERRDRNEKRAEEETKRIAKIEFDTEQAEKDRLTELAAEREIERRKEINKKVAEYMKTNLADDDSALDALAGNFVDPSQFTTIDPEMMARVQAQADALFGSIEKPEVALPEMSDTTEKMKVDFSDMLSASQQIFGLFSSMGQENSEPMQFIKKFLSGVAPLLNLLVPGLGIGVGAIAGMFNEGGMVGQPIGPNRDTILAGLTLGEYVVKRDSTKRSALLLDAINAGELDDKIFMKLQQSPVIVNVDQAKVVEAIQSMPQFDFYKNGSSLIEFRRTQSMRNESRKQRLSL